MEQRTFSPRHAAIACALSLALTTGTATPAFAAENNFANAQNQANAMSQRVEETARAYQEAEAAVSEINEQIAQNEARSAEIEAQLPGQRARTAQSIKELYIMQQATPGLIDLLLSSEDFNHFISKLHYVDTMASRYAADVTALNNMQNDLNLTQAALVSQRDEATQRQENARFALDEARRIRTELQKQADEIAQREAGDRDQAIQNALQAVAAAEASPTGEVTLAQQTTSSTQPAGTATPQASTATPQASTATPQATATPTQAATTQQPVNKPATEEQTPTATFTNASGNVAAVEVPAASSASTDPIVTNTSSDEVAQWAARIDTYLEGTELAGHGIDFAQAASDYGVDPRISPAISGVESGWGQVCFKDHNAWGWGSSSWDDWSTAIREHVEGYSDIYGSTLTLEGAEMYADNDVYDEWYATVLSEMDRI